MKLSNNSKKSKGEDSRMKLNGSEIVIECLKEQGVDTVFGYPGGTILNVYHMSRVLLMRQTDMQEQPEKSAYVWQLLVPEPRIW